MGSRLFFFTRYGSKVKVFCVSLWKLQLLNHKSESLKDARMTDETERLFPSEPQTNWRSTHDDHYCREYELSRSSTVSPFLTDDQPRGLKERITSSIWFPASFILAFSFFITVVQHGVRFNIVMYTEDVLGYTRGNAPVMIAVFDAVAPCLPLIGGWLADAWFPRLKVIITGSVITLFGKFAWMVKDNRSTCMR